MKTATAGWLLTTSATAALLPRDVSDIAFHVDTEIGRGGSSRTKTLAVSTSAMVARAGFKAAVALFPGHVILRQGSWTIADSSRGDC